MALKQWGKARGGDDDMFYTCIVPLRVLPFLGGLLRKSKGAPAAWGLDPGVLSIESTSRATLASRPYFWRAS